MSDTVLVRIKRLLRENEDWCQQIEAAVDGWKDNPRMRGWHEGLALGRRNLAREIERALEEKK